MLPSVSVIIPVYNSEKYLFQCLDSVVNQTLKDIEIICVDDESTDASVKILEEYALQDSRVKILKQKNMGAGAARNLGLQFATGKYLSFLDSDDFAEDTLYEKTVTAADNNNADIVVYKTDRYHTKEQKYYPQNWYFKKENFDFEKSCFNYKDNPGKIFNSFQNSAWNKLFRKEFIDKHGIRFQNIRRTNDLCFVQCAMASAERICLVEEILYHYRFGREDNLQATNSASDTPLDFFTSLTGLRDYLMEKDLFEEVKASYMELVMRVSLYNLGVIQDDDRVAYVYGYLKVFGLREVGLGEFVNASGEIARTKDYKDLIEKGVYPFLQIKVADLQKKLLSENKRYKELEKDNKELEKDNKELEKDNKELEKDNKELEKDNKELEKDRNRLREANTRIQKQFTDIKESLSFRVGRAITFIPRKIRDFSKSVW